MTAVGDTATSTDQFTELMARFEIACERPSRNAASRRNGGRYSADCGGMNPAEWVLWFRCGCSPSYVLYCTFCRDCVLAADSLMCHTCGFHSPGSQHYRQVEPLRSAA